MLNVLRLRAAALPPAPSEQPAPPISQGEHVLLARRADGFSSLNVRQRCPYILRASVGWYVKGARANHECVEQRSHRGGSVEWACCLRMSGKGSAAYLLL